MENHIKSDEEMMALRIHLFLGAFFVLLVSVFYALSPISLVIPAHQYDLEAALQGLVENQKTIHLIGIFGIVGDLAFAIASLGMFSVSKSLLQRMGWAWGFVANFVFLFADIILGFVMVSAASSAIGGESCRILRSFFNWLFVAGIFSMSLSVLLIFWPELKRRSLPVHGWVSIPAVLLGAISLLSSVLFLLGVETGLLMGLVVFPTCLLFMYLAVRMKESAEETGGPIADKTNSTRSSALVSRDRS